MKIKLINLEAGIEQGHLKIGVSKPDDAIWSYENIVAPMETIETQCQEIIKTLSNTNVKGFGQRSALEKLRGMGQTLSDDLLTPKIKEKLRQTDADYLILKLDDHLVHIPWELLCIEEQFLCQRFNTGRVVKTRQNTVENTYRKRSDPLKMWIIANPGGDLAGASSEGLKICEYMDLMNQKETMIDTDLDSQIIYDEIRSRIRAYDLVHFAGHAAYNPDEPGQSGWKLTKNNFTAKDIYNMAGGAAMPALVFSNACQSARTEKWEWKENSYDDAFGLANAFMLSKVRNYIGTFWEIRDEASSHFAYEFYKYLLSGKTVGESVRLARLKLMNAYDADTCWASYLLYGDPTVGYFNQNEKAEETVRTESLISSPPEHHTRGMIHFGKVKNRLDQMLFPLIIIGLLIGITLFYLKFSLTPREPSPEILSKLQELALNKKNRLDHSLKELEELLKSPPSGSPASHPLSIDNWTTSEPLTVAMDFSSKRSFANDEKENLIFSVIGKQLIDHTHARLLERISLDTIVDELKLANSKAVPPENRLMPEFLSARLILFLEISNSDSQPFVLMHIAATEKRRVIDFFIEPLSKDNLLSQKENFTKNLLKKIKELYPLRGRIVAINDKEIRLNIGDDVGVTMGQKFKVSEKDVILEVISVQADVSIVAVKQGNAVPEKGWQAEAL